MKRLSVLALSAAAMLAAGCSSDEVAVDGNSSNGGSTSNGKAYVALNLSLPSTSGAGVRADVEYNQGDPKEYNVKSLTVVYFDNSGNYIKDITYDASQLTWSTPPSSANGITTQATLPVEEMENGDKKQVLVLINNKENQVIACGTDGTLTGDASDKTWIKIKAATIKDQTNAEKFTGSSKDQFFMANSPLSNTTELVTVTPSTKIEEAKAQAKTVYVERAVAKVGLVKSDKFDTNWKTTIGTSSSYQNDEVTILNWTLDVTNKSEYALRHYNTAWNDYKNTVSTGTALTRFIDTDSNHKLVGNEVSGTTDAYRTHFAEDPNFATDVTYTSGNVVDLTSTTLPFNYVQKDMTAGEDANAVTEALTTSLYCLENTFDVAHMKEGNTTRIVVKAKYLPKSNLANGSTIADGDDWYTIGNSSLVYSGDKLADLVEAALKAADPSITEGSVTIVADQFKAGKADIAAGCFQVNSTDLTPTQLAAAQKAIGQVTTYKGGICYYTSLIKHFGDTYTPWDGTTNYTDGTETNTKNYLGRYGVVRNNSYVITLNSVTAPGKPVIPTPTNDPDDTKKYYLQTTVKIMDWAVRNNSVDF